ncbi:MAG: alanine racemase [Microbacteriaceae bacterium]|nr:alanine racemase [Microbacteriaceae bacterium]
MDQPFHEARISTEAIRANAAVLAARLGDRILVADVSADALGHGAVASAHAAIAGGARAIAVEDEAAAGELREAGVLAEILVGVEAVAEPLYGLDDDEALRPAMTVSALVVGTKRVEPGDGVSYGYTWRAQRAGHLAMVRIGYADGLDRIASNTGTLVLGNQRRRIAGRVAMNVLMLDLGEDEALVGDRALVFGGTRRASEWARSIERRPDEVAIEFAQKLPRFWS